MAEGTVAARREDARTMLRVSDLARYFDVSRPLLNRIFEKEGRQTLRAVDGISFEIAPGETLALVGESGCGKSTVARCVVGLYPLTRGTIEFDGIDIGTLGGVDLNVRFRRRIQMIFQDPYASLNPRWRVFNIIAEPIRAHRLLNDQTAIQKRVDELLRHVGLSPADGTKYPHEFSGGQRQRISIARALASEPDFLVCDEPTSALDVSVQAQILNLMKDLQREFDLTYLFISHNLAVVRHISDKVGVMYLGKLCELADTQSLFTRPGHPYTQLLLDTIPALDMSGRDRRPVAGEVPNPINPPSGCYFHPRCPFADDRCSREVPVLRAVEGGHVACHAVEEGRIAETTRTG